SHCRDMPQDKKLYSDSLGYVLVPEELFREGDAEKYFGLHGIESKEEEYTVCSKPVCGTVAILRLEKKVMEKLGSRLGAFDVAHMLQYNMEQDACIPENSHRIRVYISPRLCHITAYDAEGLVVAESYPADSAADVAYYLDCITGRYGLSSDIPVVVDGHRAEEVAAIVSRNFKGVRCV
ncbi:MAG: DUF3822 family protein, partial [Alistipes sp.]|nr:DUF3822 family protein [Alistipes sp.]